MGEVSRWAAGSDSPRPTSSGGVPFHVATGVPFLLAISNLATILEQATPDDARELLDQWLDWASRSRLAPFVKLARTIRKHAVGILAYLDTRMTNGPVEGINNKLRVIARRAYGFHSHGALISMLFLCCGGIELAPPLPTRV